MKKKMLNMVFCIVACLVSIVLMGNVAAILGGLGLPEKITELISRTVVSGIIIIVIWKMGLLCKEEYHIRGLGKKMRSAWIDLEKDAYGVGRYLSGRDNRSICFKFNLWNGTYC